MHSCYLSVCFFAIALMPSCTDHCIGEFIHLDELMTSVINILVYQCTLNIFSKNGKRFK